MSVNTNYKAYRCFLNPQDGENKNIKFKTIKSNLELASMKIALLDFMADLDCPEADKNEAMNLYQELKDSSLSGKAEIRTKLDQFFDQKTGKKVNTEA